MHFTFFRSILSFSKINIIKMYMGDMFMNNIFKSSIVRGTFVLSTCGILCRLMGFYFKIYLSDNIGLEMYGLYQMLLPLASLGTCIGLGGLMPVLQRNVAFSLAKKRKDYAVGFLYTTLFISLSIAVLVSLFMFFSSELIAKYIICDNRVIVSVKILSFTIIPACIHECINTYFLGQSKTLIPAISQFIEQLSKIGAVMFIVEKYAIGNSHSLVTYGIIGILVGEVVSSLFSLFVFLYNNYNNKACLAGTFSPTFYPALPLFANKLFLHISLSLEAFLTPACLCKSGYSYSDSLSIYGMLSGMAMSLIMLPSTFIGSFSTLLLPKISKNNAINNNQNIAYTIKSALNTCIFTGILCLTEFVLLGNDFSMVLFSNSSIGSYVTVLGWLCPFIYISSVCSSILNGLGKHNSNFFVSLFSILVKILGILTLIPFFSLKGLLLAFLISSILSALLYYYEICHHTRQVYSINRALIFSIIAFVIAYYVITLTANLFISNLLITTFVKAVIIAAIFAIALIGYKFTDKA